MTDAPTLADLMPVPPDEDALYDAFTTWADEQGLSMYPAQQEALSSSSSPGRT